VHKHARGTRIYALTLVVMMCGLATSFAESVSGQDSEETSDRSPGFKVMQGRDTFRLFCASCHGANADGQGQLAEHLTVAPADLTKISERYGGDYPSDLIYRIVDGRETVKGHGSADMPVWGDVFQHELASDSQTDEDPENRAARKIESLVVFLASLQPPDESEANNSSENH